MVPPLQRLPALNKTLPFRRTVLASFSPPLSLRRAEKILIMAENQGGRGKEEEEATLQNFRGGNGEWRGGGGGGAVLFYDIALLAPGGGLSPMCTVHTRLVLRTGLLISVKRGGGKDANCLSANFPLPIFMERHNI